MYSRTQGLNTEEIQRIGYDRYIEWSLASQEERVSSPPRIAYGGVARLDDDPVCRRVGGRGARGTGLLRHAQPRLYLQPNPAGGRNHHQPTSPRIDVG